MNKVGGQGGVALLMILTAVVLVSLTFLVTRLNRTDMEIGRQERTAQALAQAKEALLGYAATYAETHPGAGKMPGYLPCPDKNGDGDADPACASKERSVIGRLPWKTLGISPLRAGDGECLWYAVSSNYKNDPVHTLTNTSEITSGSFIVKNVTGETVAGSSPETRAIAIVFAPGKPILGRTRSVTPGEGTECGSNKLTLPLDGASDVSNYLDSYQNTITAVSINNTTGNDSIEYVETPSKFFATKLDVNNIEYIPTFITAPLSTRELVQTTFGSSENPKEEVFNDSMIVITPKDYEPIYERMNYWVAKQVITCFEDYMCGSTGNCATFKQCKSNCHNAKGSCITACKTDPSPNPCEKQCNITWKTCTKNCKTSSGLGALSWAAPINDLTYTATNKQRFGRIPTIPSSSSWPTGCFDSAWWSVWKEQVFYALGNDYAPSKAHPSYDLTVKDVENNVATKVDFVVVVAGRRITNLPPPSSLNQVRSVDDPDKITLNNYLENDNITPATQIQAEEDGEFIFRRAEDDFNDAVCSDVSCP